MTNIRHEEMESKQKTLVESIWAVYRGEDPGRVIWQPRIEFWFDVNQKAGTLPAYYRDMTMRDIYDDLELSRRYFTFPLREEYEKVKVVDEWNGAILVRNWHTPIGSLREVLRYTHEELTPYRLEHRVKTPDDLRTLTYILDDTQYQFDSDAYTNDVRHWEGRGIPQFYYRRIPLQQLIIDDMGFETTIFALKDEPKMMEKFLEDAERFDDRMYEVLLASPVPIFNFGDNIDANLDSPPVFTRYLLPVYRKRTSQIRAAGKYSHIHMDGSLRPLLPYMRSGGWDGIEAATPVPQGDVELEELRESINDLVFLDGIPAIYFLSEYPEGELIECFYKVVELFYPRLILGIADELPPGADIERVRLISKLVGDFNKKIGSC